MPFKSKQQMKACFASNGFHGKIDCDEWAKDTNYKSLPNKKQDGGYNMYRPNKFKKRGKMQVGGLQPYLQSNTAAGSITPTGQSSLATNSQLSPEEIQALSQQYGFRTDNNQNFQQDLFNYAQKNQPAAYNSVYNKFGQTNAGTFVDGILGARTSNLARSLQRPAPAPNAPQQAALSEWIYGQDKHSLGTASQPYRDSKSQSDPGIMNGPEGPQYVDFMYNKPESQETDPSRGRYRIPYNVWSNLVTKGTTTADPSVIEQYKPAAIASMRMFGGRIQRMQMGGPLGSFTTANDPLVPGMNAPMQDIPVTAQTQTPMDPLQDLMAKGLLETPHGYDNTQQWYTAMNQPQPQQQAPRMRGNTAQNIGIGMMQGSNILSEISGRVERGRQNRYDYQQQSALGMQGAVPSSSFQPTPYSLYAKYGGKLKHYQQGGTSYKPPMPDYSFMGDPTKKDSDAYKQHFYDYLYNRNHAVDRWNAAGRINMNSTPPEMRDSIENMFSAWSDAEDDMLNAQYRRDDQKRMRNAIGPTSAGGQAARATMAKMKAGVPTYQQGGRPSYNFPPATNANRSDSTMYGVDFNNMMGLNPDAMKMYMNMQRYGIPPTLSEGAYRGAHNTQAAYEDAIGQMKGAYGNLRKKLPILPEMKKGGIHINPKNKGKFTEYCGGEVTGECIQKGLHSDSATIRKRANFARNARKFNH